MKELVPSPKATRRDESQSKELVLSQSKDWAAVVLAAGKGTRMRSDLPKMMHPLAGRAMVCHVMDALEGLAFARTVLVVGHGAAQVRAAVGSEVTYVEQAKQLGTGHALLQAQPFLDGGPEHVLVVNGDMPLITGGTLRGVMDHHRDTGAAVTLLTSLSPSGDGPSTGQPTGQAGSAQGPPAGSGQSLGRVVRDGLGRIVKVVEAAEASPLEQEGEETNAGVYGFRASWLWSRLAQLPASQSGEYYLTALVEKAAQEGESVQAVRVPDPWEALGVNTRVQLAQAEGALRQRVRERLMLAGVTLLDPTSTFIDAGVEIGQDTVIYPHTTIGGATRIGSDCHIGPNCIVTDSAIGRGCRVVASMLEGATLEDEVEVGPFSHLRPGAHLCTGVHLGNFVEVKKSRLGRNTKAGHFTYIGDATVGADVNIGAGTVTCNFDGVDKLPTIIGDDAFIGCDTMLVAPIEVGARAVTGAGSVVTRDVPPDTLVVGVPARPQVKGRSQRKA